MKIPATLLARILLELRSVSSSVSKRTLNFRYVYVSSFVGEPGSSLC